MEDLPTIELRGYDVDISWVNLVKSALVGDPHLPVPPAEGPVITIPEDFKPRIRCHLKTDKEPFD